MLNIHLRMSFRRLLRDKTYTFLNIAGLAVGIGVCVLLFLAVFISCLGLYGLVSFMAAQRTREIGLRKVLGASVTDVMVLLSRESTLLIGLSFLLAAPVAWLLMQRWLDGFAYRIRPGVGIFLAAAACSLIVAWATVGYRAYRAAAANPVAALRNE